jgi:beta-mannosidase
LYISNTLSVVLNLDGSDWVVQNRNGSLVYKSTVPGNIYADLMAVGKLGDPYYRFNVDEYRWVGFEEWIFRKRFDISSEILQGNSVFLVFDGLDTIAHIELNGRSIGNVNNMFRKYKFKIPKEILKKEDNILEVHFQSSAIYAESMSKKYPYPVPATTYPDEIANRNFIRREQSTFGWDWGPAFLATGIWKSVKLVSVRTLAIYESSVIVTKVCLT